MSERVGEVQEAEIPSEFDKITSRAYQSSDAFYVKSATVEGKWHLVRDGVCSCKGFEFRHRCNHTDHLLKMGYIVHDAANGYGFIVSDGLFRQDGWEVESGVRKTPKDAPVEIAIRDEQIIRLQALVRAYKRMVDDQRAAIAAYRIGHDAAIPSILKSMQTAQFKLDEAEGAMMRGDVVELPS